MVYTIFSILLAAAALVLAYMGYLWGAIVAWAVAAVLIARQYQLLRCGRESISIVLKAIRNGDYTFSLKNDGTGVNQSLNQIKLLVQDARREVEAQEKFLSVIIECVATGVIIIASDGFVRFINRAALSYLSLPALTHTDRLRQLYPELFAVLRATRSNEIKTITIQTEKESLQLAVQLRAVALASGEMQVITLNDINSQLDQKETDSWISLIRVMTHEIMNSVAPIRSIAEVLLNAEEPFSDATRKAIQTIHGTSDTLIRFVEDYRKFSAVPPPRRAPVEVAPLLQQAVTLIARDAEAKRISVDVNLSLGDHSIVADQSLLLQVLHNLLKNAVEATPEGGAIAITSALTRQGRPSLRVYNSGAPIDAATRPYIFIPFFTTKQGGSGIGLSLSRYIMRLHGGNLTYQPQPAGSVFVVEF